jgi:hypothetical protein
MRNLFPYETLIPFIERGEKVTLLESLVPFRERKALGPVTLDDDRVPVDQLLAPVFRDSLEEAGAGVNQGATPTRCPTSET